MNRHHHTTANASTPTLTQPTTQHILPHTATYCHILPQTTTYYTTKHHQTQHPFSAKIQVHFIPSGTRLAQLHQDSCFLHVANMFGQQGMGQGPMHSGTWGQVGAVRGRAIIVIVTERREERREREGKEKRKRTKEEIKTNRREEKNEREREGSRVQVPNVSVCWFKRSPCVRAKRACVEHMRAFCRYTRKRFACTHGDVWNLHTGGFRMPSRATHRHHRHQTPHRTHVTHTRMLGHVHGGQPTVTLREFSTWFAGECLDMVTT